MCRKKGKTRYEFLEINHYLAAAYSHFMKKLISEKNIAGVLFVLVMAAFSFAHEDSKKKDPQYNITASQNYKLTAPDAITIQQLTFRPHLTGRNNREDR